MSITFSMSSQLWINVKITDEMKPFLIQSVSVDIGRKYTFIQLYDKENVSHCSLVGESELEATSAELEATSAEAA
jgi:hypothetical protein